MSSARPAAALAAASMLMMTAGCTAEQNSRFLSPASPTVAGGQLPHEGDGGLSGAWRSQAAPPLHAWNCTGFEWRITDQTDSSVSGSFTGVCNESVLVSGHGSGELRNNLVSIQVDGSARLDNGAAACPFYLKALGHIEGPDTMRLVYGGTSCEGPVSGEEVLERSAIQSVTETSGAGETPSPPEPVAPPNPFHVDAGPLSEDRARLVVEATGREFAHLRRTFSTDAQAIRAAEELLLRTIWHLKLAGFSAARQQNPSGAISNDKLTILIGSRWRAYDIFKAYDDRRRPMEVIFYEVSPPKPVEHAGIAD